MEFPTVVQNASYEEMNLDVPTLEDISKALSDGLLENFAEVQVNIVDCPDLTLPPYNLASKGLCGNETVVQVGDVFFVVPNTRKDKIYDFRNVSKAIKVDPAFIMGAGGGYWCRNNHFSEMFMNIFVSESGVRNQSRETFSKDETIEGLTVEDSVVNNANFACLGNLFISRGDPGPVVRITCKRRRSEKNLPESIIAAVKKKFNQVLAFGMVFQMVRGKARHHVARTFAKNIVNTTESEKLLLLFPEIEAPFVSVGTILTSDPPGSSIAPFHFHSHNNKQRGGHYRCDTTPEEAEYVAYVKPASRFCLIDRATKQFILTDFRAE